MRLVLCEHICNMRIVASRLREIQWQEHEPRLRLHIFEGAENDLQSFDLVEHTIVQALDSARMLSDENRKLWSLAVLNERDAAGLIWVSGYDYRSTPTHASEWRLRKEMQDRYLSAMSQRGEEPRLPDGLRVIRLMPEWSVELPLWESFTDSYLISPGEVSIAQKLECELTEWNRDWQSYGFENERPKSWFDRGWQLHEQLQIQLAETAEVRPDFAL